MRRRYVALAILACTAALSAGGARGRERSPEPERKADRRTTLDTLFWAPEIIVEAARITSAPSPLQRSGFVALIDLEPSTERLEDAATVLARTVGVRVRQYGGLGSFATMSIRGSSSSQVQIYLDGVPLNDAYSGVTDLADLPIGDVRTIEVYRGFSPTGFGASSIGGTVNLVSRSIDDRPDGGTAPRIEASISSGSFHTQRYLLSLAARVWRAGFRFHGGHMRSEGDFLFDDDNATPENPYDDVEAVRMNNDFTRWHYSGRLTFDLPGFRSLSLNYDVTSREAGVPGIGANQSTDARYERERRLSYVKVKPRTVFGDRLHTDLTGFYSWTAERFTDPAGKIDLSVQETDNRIAMYGMNVRAKLFTPVLPTALEIFFEGRKDRFHPVSLLPKPITGPDRLRHTRTLCVSGDLSLADDRIILTAGARHEWSENEFYDEPFMPWLPPTPLGRTSREELAPHAGFRVRPHPDITIKGNIGEHYRAPTFFELFGNRGSVTGSSDLENETGTNRDIGVIFSRDRCLFVERPFLELAYLHNNVENLILFFPNSQSTMKPENVGSTRTRGVELSLSGMLPRSVRIAGNYCYLDGKDTGPIPHYNGNELAGRPAHQGAFEIELVRRRWSVSYGWIYIGRNFLKRANREEVAARSIHNLSIVVRSPRHGIALSVEGRNVGDERVSDVSGFPLPGRSIYATLKYSR